MSTLGGILHYGDNVSLRRDDTALFERLLDQTAPDGGDSYRQRQIAMWYRAFHTTEEAKREYQPYIGADCVVTWDGRLDNREELRDAVRLGNRWDGTDLALVVEAYKAWGQECFSHFVGDWAIAIWDVRDRELLLARDFIGVRRLFYRMVSRSFAWCSTMEPLVQTTTAKLTPDLEYLVGCIVPRPPIERTPYEEIGAVLPGFFLRCDRDGNIHQQRFWNVQSEEAIRYKRDEEYEEHFRHVLRNAVKRRMRTNTPILADLSGGLDSSCIVCVADELSKASDLPFMETLSYFNTNDPSGDERPYFEEIERFRGRPGHHIAQADFDVSIGDEALASLPNNVFVATPGYFARSLRWAERLAKIRSSVGARISFSGIGGDELLGGVPYGVPELAEHLLSGHIGPFLKCLLAWARQGRRTTYSLATEAAELIALCRIPGLARRALPERPAWIGLPCEGRDRWFTVFTDWRSLSPTQAHMERLRYSLSSQLTCTDTFLAGPTERRYPLLDESLFRFLASIPRTQVIQVGKRRHLMRRALAGIVPEKVLWRRSKWFATRTLLTQLQSQSQYLRSLFRTNVVGDYLRIDERQLLRVLDKAFGGIGQDAQYVTGLLAVEYWLREQLDAERINSPQYPSQSLKSADKSSSHLGLQPQRRI